MTKVYLVYAQGCTSDGTLDTKGKKYVFAVFTNGKLADKCAEYLNKKWYEGHERNADFKAEMIRFHWVQIEHISRTDYSKLPY